MNSIGTKPGVQIQHVKKVTISNVNVKWEYCSFLIFFKGFLFMKILNNITLNFNEK